MSQIPETGEERGPLWPGDPGGWDSGWWWAILVGIVLVLAVLFEATSRL